MASEHITLWVDTAGIIAELEQQESLARMRNILGRKRTRKERKQEKRSLEKAIEEAANNVKLVSNNSEGS